MIIPRIGRVAGCTIVAVFAGVAWLGGCVATEKAEAPGRGVAERPSGGPATEDYPDTSRCDGRPVETIEERYPDGSLWHRREVVKLDDGAYVSHGLTTVFWQEEGTKKTELEFVCGVRDGRNQSWYPNGNKWQEGQNVRGKGHGEWKMWAPGGALVQQYTLDHGAWNGPFMQWYPNGEKKMEVEWVNGRRQGPEVYWYENGQEARRIEYHDGVPQPPVGPGSE